LHRLLDLVGKKHDNIIQSYRDDFPSYSGRIDPERLDEVVDVVPASLGKKFVYRSVNPLIQTPPIKKALELLCKARVCHKVRASASNGVPLAAELLHKYFKVRALHNHFTQTV